VYSAEWKIIMAYPSLPCPWDEANFPVWGVGPSPLQKLCPQIPGSSGLSPLIHCSIYTLWMPPARILFPFCARGYTHNVLLSWPAAPRYPHTPECLIWKRIDEDASEIATRRRHDRRTNGNEIKTSDYAKVWGRSKEVVSVFTYYGSTQLSI